MATIRSFTSPEQSRKLAEILPLESADMFYVAGKGEPIFILDKMVASGKDDYDALGGPDVLCWSLAALLNVISNIFKYNLDYNGISFILTVGDFEASNKTAVDACYEMIIRLHELNLL